MKITEFGLGIAICAALTVSACGGDSAENLMESARTHIRQKDNKAAIVQLKNVLQKDASQPEARFLLGKMLLETRDPVGAELELAKARELGYPEAQITPLMAQILMMRNQAEKLLADYGKVTLTDPAAQAELDTTLAAAYAMQSQQRKARESIDAALQAAPQNVRAQLFNIRLLATEGKSDEALRLLDTALAGPAASNSEAWQIKGELLQFSGADTAKSIEAFKQALTLDKSNIAAHSGIINGLLRSKDMAGSEAQLATLKKLYPNAPQTRYHAAILALERKDLNRSAEEVQALLKMAPESPQALFLAGYVEFQRGGLISAVTYLAKALASDPNNSAVRILLARTYMRTGEPNKSLATIQSLLERTDAPSDAVAIAAEANMQLGENKLAESLFERAAKLNPNDARSRTALALTQMSKGQAAEGFNQLHIISEADPGATADLALISAHMNRNDVAAALQAIDKLEKKLPNRPVAANLRGRIEWSRGERDKARQSFEAALKIDPSFFPAASSLGTMDVEDKKPELALKRFEAMAQADPRNVQAQMSIVALRGQELGNSEALAELIRGVIKKNPGAVSPRVALVKLQLQRRESKLALAAAQEGVAAIPDSAEMFDLLGQVLTASGDTNQAAAAFNKMASLQPGSPVPYMKLADLYRIVGDRVGAIQSLKRALGIRADFYPAQVALLNLELGSGNVGEARAIVRSVHKQRPNDPVAFSIEGDVEASQKNYSGAVNAYRAGLDKRQSSELAVKLHTALLAADRGDEAKKLEGQWIQNNPKDTIFLSYLGDRAIGKSDWQQSAHYFQEVIKRDPQNTVGLNNMAWVLKNAGKLGPALEYAERANTLLPRQPAFMDTLAEIHAAAGRLGKAIDIQKEAVLAGPDMHLHRLHLAKYYASAGKKSEAKAELQILAALGDKFAQQAEVRKLMSTL